MTQTALLNPGNSDAHCSNEILDSLRKELKAAEDAMTHTRLDTYAEYTAAYSRVQALRKVLGAADQIYGKRFRT